MKKNDLIALMRCTQTELAKMLGITQGAVAQWEDVPPAHYLRLRYEIAPRLAWPEKAKPRSASLAEAVTKLIAHDVIGASTNLPNFGQ